MEGARPKPAPQTARPPPSLVSFGPPGAARLLAAAGGRLPGAASSLSPGIGSRLMYVNVHQFMLLPELALVAAAAQPGSPIRALSQVRIEARETYVLRLTAHNLEYGIASELSAQVIEPGVIFLPAAKLLSL